VIVVAYGDPDDEHDDLLKLVYAGVSRAIDDLVVVADPTYRKALRIGSAPTSVDSFGCVTHAALAAL
jgi:hypothetical protein